MPPGRDRWLFPARPNSAAKLRLFCFPHAGGSARAFASWPARLGQEIEVLGVQLPGREERLGEPPFTRLQPLVEALVPVLMPYLDRPFALFGHSLGALVAFETARALRYRGQPQPTHLFVSGRAAPTILRTGAGTHTLSDADFRARLRDLKGTPAEVLASEELMGALLPMLRADFAVSETYVYPGGDLLDCPMSIYGGHEDATLCSQELDAWRHMTTGSVTLRLFPGDHFYLRNPIPFFAAMTEDLDRTSGREAGLADLQLREGDVHLWRIRLDPPLPAIDRLAESLSPDERERAARFMFDQHRHRFRAARGSLRQVLARYLHVSPAEIAFQIGPAGKPDLVSSLSSTLRFNLSHSGDLALIGVTLGRQIGVDVEHVRPMPNALGLAERFFAPGERQVLRELPEQEQVHAFFRCWTRKEAYMKACGLGLSLGLERFEVAFRPGATARLLHVEGQPNESLRWWLADIPAGHEYIGACAVEGGPCPVVVLAQQGALCDGC
jgi:medium-chain acyl-[acyl-carrier-protein] hydrolase